MSTRILRPPAVIMATLVAAGAAVFTSTAPAAAGSAPMHTVAAAATARPHPPGIVPPCARPRARFAQCFFTYQPQASVNRARAAGRTGTAAAPAGWGARQLEAAYRLPVSQRSHQTVAVSIAFHTPHLARFLAVYRRQFGLPPCSLASGCFRVVNQRGRSSPLAPPGVGTGWDLEATLDVSMISAACPHCRILVVEADDDSTASLARTDVTAARLGAQVISNSYGTRETGFALRSRGDYLRPGHRVVASAGDIGYTAANFPADLATVTAVGGTTLTRSPGRPRGWAERTWNNLQGAGGSGCSAYVAKPARQHDPHCPGRTIADVAAVGTNVPVFEPVYGGWLTVSGTSVSAPLIAGIYGLAGNGARIGPGYLYAHRRGLFDVTVGNNSLSVPPAKRCGGDYLCTARRGYDAPTGLGTPDGITAF
jgi:hypothetical protein